MTIPSVRGFSLALIAAAALTAAACGGEHAPLPPPSRAPIAAAIDTAAETDWPRTYEVGAVVRSRQTAVLSSRIVAPIIEIRVSGGDRVRRGQPLVILDGRELQAHAARAVAGATGSSLALDAARAELRAAEAALLLARTTHDRVRGLQEKNSATRQELDEAAANFAGAEARVAGATARVAEAEQGIAAARAAQDAAAAGVTYTTLTAPFDGVVAARHADPGTLAAPGVPILTLDDASGYRLEAHVDESFASWARPGVEVDCRVDRGDGADPWQRLRVAEAAAVDAARHQFLVKVDLPAEPAGVRSGQFGRLRLLGPSRPVLSVPASAVVHRGQVAFVFVLDEHAAARLRMVSTGETAAERTEIRAGLSSGERVIAAPPPGLTDGQPISADGAAR